MLIETVFSNLWRERTNNFVVPELNEYALQSPARVCVNFEASRVSDLPQSL